MNKQDLRTGNYILFGGLVHCLQTIGQWCKTDITVDTIPLDRMSPILLTEEWLILFGFNILPHHFFELNGILLTFITDEQYFQFETSNKIIDVKTVNQLQNLFYALTGEELKTYKQ